MQHFTGAFERQIDIKGRLALPAIFRARLGELCYLTLGSDNSIEVFSSERFALEADRITAAQARGEVSMNFLRAFAANAMPVEPDAQGRIYLDQRLRRHAKLDVKSPAMVSGRIDRVEICSMERFERSMAAGESEFSESQDV